MTTDDLVALGGTAAIILPMVYFATGSRRQRTLKWMRSDTRGAKIFRAFFGELEREPLCLPKQPRPRKYWLAIGVSSVLMLASLSVLIWGDNVPGLHSLDAPIFAVSGTILVFLLAFRRSHYWPSALTKDLIEGLYRPQVERLREIATHWGRYAHESEGPLETDIELFSIPSVFSATVATGSLNKWAVVGGNACGFLPGAPKILETSYFIASNPQFSDAGLIPGSVRLSDHSRKNAVIYRAVLIDDGGERREFELCLNLKMVTSQIPKATTSRR